MSGRVVLVTADLMFGSKVESMIRRAGFEASVTAAIPQSGEGDALWVADLAQGDFEPEDFAGKGVPVLAFYSHVDDDIRRRAADAGIDQAVPRSRMNREGDALIARLARK